MQTLFLFRICFSIPELFFNLGVVPDIFKGTNHRHHGRETKIESLTNQSSGYDSLPEFNKRSKAF